MEVVESLEGRTCFISAFRDYEHRKDVHSLHLIAAGYHVTVVTQLHPSPGSGGGLEKKLKGISGAPRDELPRCNIQRRRVQKVIQTGPKPSGKDELQFDLNEQRCVWRTECV